MANTFTARDTLKTKLLAALGSATNADQIVKLSRTIEKANLDDDADLETALDTKVSAMATTASTGDIEKLAFGVKKLRTAATATDPVSSMVPEGSSNLYVTDSRVRSSFSASGDLSYDSGTGVLSYTALPDALTVYATVADLPLPENTNAGAKGIVEENKKLYINSGSSWLNVGLVDQKPVMTTNPDGSYTLSPGADTVITLTATDPQGDALTWSYIVSSGALGGSSVAQADNVFTITGSSNTADTASFSITFRVSDGTNIADAVSEFTVNFGPDWSTVSKTVSFGNPWYDKTWSNQGTPSGYAGGGRWGQQKDEMYGTSADKMFAMNSNAVFLGQPKQYTTVGDESGTISAFDHSGNLLWVKGKHDYYNSGNSDVGQRVVANDNYLVISSIRSRHLTGRRDPIGTALILDPTDGSVLHFIDGSIGEGIGTGDAYGAFGSSLALFQYEGTDHVAIGEQNTRGSLGEIHVYRCSDGVHRWTIDAHPEAAKSNYGGIGCELDASDDYIAFWADGVDFSEYNSRGISQGSANGGLRKYHFWTKQQCLDEMGYWYADYSTRSGYTGAQQHPGGEVVIVTADSSKTHVRTITNPNPRSSVFSDPSHSVYMSNSWHAQDYFGRNIKIHGDKIAIASFGQTVPNGSGGFRFDAGAVYMFEISTGNLLWTVENTYSTANDTQFGMNMVFSDDGSVLFVSGRAASGGQANMMSVKVLSVSDGSLVTSIGFPNDGVNGGNTFGGGIATHDNKVLITSYNEGLSPYDESGTGYIFEA